MHVKLLIACEHLKTNSYEKNFTVNDECFSFNA